MRAHTCQLFSKITDINPDHVQLRIGVIAPDLVHELIRREYAVDVGVVTDRSKGQNVQKEIDFVVNAADKKIYIQSAFQMETEQKITSEISSLLLAKDFFKKWFPITLKVRLNSFVRISAHRLGIYTTAKRLFLLVYTKRDVRLRNKRA